MEGYNFGRITATIVWDIENYLANNTQTPASASLRETKQRGQSGPVVSEAK